MKLDITRDDQAQCYVATLDGKRVGELDYQDLGDSLMLTHTEIDPEYSGHGLGGELVQGVLEELREEGRLIVPQCSFVAGFIQQHPEYLELVHPNQRGALTLEEQPE